MIMRKHILAIALVAVLGVGSVGVALANGSETISNSLGIKGVNITLVDGFL